MCSDKTRVMHRDLQLHCLQVAKDKVSCLRLTHESIFVSVKTAKGHGMWHGKIKTTAAAEDI